MKKILFFILACLTLSACNLADKRVDELRQLTESVERRGERFTTQEWIDTYHQYEQLNADFRDLELTEAQKDTVYYLNERFMKAAAMSPVKKVGNTYHEVIQDIYEESQSILEETEGLIDEFTNEAEDRMEKPQVHSSK